MTAGLRRFPRRFIGLRDSMVVYDTSDPEQAAALAEAFAADDPGERLAVSTFAPDTLEEARNRGFKEFRVQS